MGAACTRAAPAADAATAPESESEDEPAQKPPTRLTPAPPAAISWQRGELLGSGAFGRVYSGLNLDTGELLAVKEVLLSGRSSAAEAESLSELQKEVSLLRTLSHPNIVRYLGSERTPEAVVILLELVPGGSVASLLSRFGPFGERVTRVYIRQVLEGLCYLHSHGVMHRDVKGANLLVDNNGVVKLADFGASRQLASLVTLSGGCQSVRGTPYWMAPEVIRQTGHGRQADIWSVGCVVIECVTAKPPWSGFTTPISAMFHIANAKGPPPFPPDCSTEMADFLTLCLNRQPRERPNAARLLRHPFVTTPAAGVTPPAEPPSPLRRAVSSIPENARERDSPLTPPSEPPAARDVGSASSADPLSLSLSSVSVCDGLREGGGEVARRLEMGGGASDESLNPVQEPSWGGPGGAGLPADEAAPAPAREEAWQQELEREVEQERAAKRLESLPPRTPDGT